MKLTDETPLTFTALPTQWFIASPEHRQPNPDAQEERCSSNAPPIRAEQAHEGD